MGTMLEDIYPLQPFYFLDSLLNYNLDIAKHSPNIHPPLLFSRNTTTLIVLIHSKIKINNRSRIKDIKMLNPQLN